MELRSAASYSFQNFGKQNEEDVSLDHVDRTSDVYKQAFCVTASLVAKEIEMLFEGENFDEQDTNDSLSNRSLELGPRSMTAIADNGSVEEDPKSNEDETPLTPKKLQSSHMASPPSPVSVAPGSSWDWIGEADKKYEKNKLPVDWYRKWCIVYVSIEKTRQNNFGLHW